MQNVNDIACICFFSVWHIHCAYTHEISQSSSSVSFLNANKQKNKSDGTFQSQVYTIVEQIIDAKWYIDIITNDICMDMVSLVVERMWETATAHNPSRLVG